MLHETDDLWTYKEFEKKKIQNTNTSLAFQISFKEEFQLWKKIFDKINSF